MLTNYMCSNYLSCFTFFYNIDSMALSAVRCLGVYLIKLKKKSSAMNNDIPYLLVTVPVSISKEI